LMTLKPFCAITIVVVLGFLFVISCSAKTLSDCGIEIRGEGKREHELRLQQGRCPAGAAHYETANQLISKAKLADAEIEYRIALSLYEKRLGVNDLEVAGILDRIATCSSIKGDYREAESMYKRAIEILRAKNQSKAIKQNTTETIFVIIPDYYDVLQRLAYVYCELKRYPESEALYKELLASAPEPGTYGSATAIQNMAYLYEVWGKTSELEPVYKRWSAIDRVGGSQRLGKLYTKLKRYSEAEPLLLDVLKTEETKCGATHCQTSYAVIDLANLYRDWGKYKQADELYRRALTNDETSMGKESTNVAVDLQSYARFMRMTKNTAKAEQFEERANKILKIPMPKGK
jgi:tetratricopeptide (TPR) repeat protein